MSKLKKSHISLISVILSICIITASVIWVKRDKKSVPAAAESTTKKVTATKPVSTTKKVTTTKKETTAPSTAQETETVTEIVTLENGETVTVITTVKPVTTKPVTTTTTTTKPAPAVSGSHEIAGSVPKKAAVSGSYFDDAVFVGDSISLKLSYYEASVNKLGKAQFLVAGSLSATNALWEVSDKSVHPRYNGKKQKIEDSISQMKNVKKVYIMLGMNDIGVAGIDGGVKNLETLCNKILAKSPNVKIYIQSVTPMAKGSNVASSKEGKLNNKSIIKYNQKLAALANRRGWYFINVASVMYDSEGYLKREYCGDLDSMGIHFTNAGCSAWVDYLLTHTP